MTEFETTIDHFEGYPVGTKIREWMVGECPVHGHEEASVFYVKTPDGDWLPYDIAGDDAEVAEFKELQEKDEIRTLESDDFRLFNDTIDPDSQYTYYLLEEEGEQAA